MKIGRILMVYTVMLLVALVLTGFWLWTPDRSLAALHRSYLASPDDLVEVAGIRLHVRDSGPADAPALILLHGFGATLHTWESWARSLSGAYRVIRLDLPGFGLTGPDPTGDYSDERAMQVINALMDQRGLDRAHLIGNSLGGRIAWRFAAAHPDRVDRLVLMAPDGFASPGIEYDSPPEVPLLMHAMKFTLPRFLLRMNLQPAYADPAALTDERLARYHDLMLAPGVRQAILDRLSQLRLPGPEPILARIRAPVLLLWGREDALIPLANAADYQAALPDSQLVVLNAVGHLPQEEAPSRSLAPVREFLRD